MASRQKFYLTKFFIFTCVYISLSLIATISTIISYMLTGFIVDTNILIIIVSVAYINICFKIINL